MKATLVMDAVAADLIGRLEAGAADPAAWRLPWHGRAGGLLPANAATGKAYRGGNVIGLWIGAAALGTEQSTWATYRQWQQLGAQVRKGERGTHAVKWTQIVRDDGTAVEDDKGHGSRMVPYGFTLFNACQVDGWEPEPLPDFGAEPIEECERFFSALGAKVRFDPSQAYYSRTDDTIGMPALEQFPDVERYYSTLAHEQTHWTGHESRMARPGGSGFGTDAYAYEELIAELGAAFLCALMGISAEPRDDHAQYLASRARQLKTDSRALWRAASQAQAAVDWMAAHAGAELLAA